MGWCGAAPDQPDRFHLEFQRVTRPFRLVHFLSPKTDFEPSAKEYVFRGQGQETNDELASKRSFAGINKFIVTVHEMLIVDFSDLDLPMYE